MAVVAFAARPTPVETCADLSLGMAQLSPDGLSEQWVLRFCGDLHWALIAKALGQREAVFRASDGRPVYAAFCATSLRLQPSRALLGRDVKIASALSAVSETRTGSTHSLVVDGVVVAELSMISTFVSHDTEGCNTRIHRNSVLGQMHLPPAGQDLLELDRQARDTARSLRGRVMANSPETYTERPVPALDFNAVGLLYFPTFSRIAETAAHAHAGRLAPVLRREVVHLGNINPGDRVHAHGGEAKVLTRTDGVPIAYIKTERGTA